MVYRGDSHGCRPPHAWSRSRPGVNAPGGVYRRGACIQESPGVTVTTNPVQALVAGYGATSPTLSWNAPIGLGRPMVLSFAFVETVDGVHSPMGAGARAAARQA